MQDSTGVMNDVHVHMPIHLFSENQAVYPHFVANLVEIRIYLHFYKRVVKDSLIVPKRIK